MLKPLAADEPAEMRLSRRELQVLEHLAQGATYQAIAHRLQLSPHTVDSYLRRIRSKTGATNRTELALLAFSLGHRPRGHRPDGGT